MTMPSNAPPSSGWTVTAQGAPMTSVTADQRVFNGVTVYFTTGNGTRSSVFVPEDVYSPENVRMLIAQKAAMLDGVDALSAEPTPQT